MEILVGLQIVAWLLIVVGVIALVLGLIPATHPRVGDTRGWGVTLILLGISVLVLLYIIPAVLS